MSSEPDGQAASAGRPDEAAHWHRLHPLSPVVRTGRALGVLVLALLVRGVAARGNLTETLVDTGVVLVVLVLGAISWLVTRWQVVEGVLRIETGWIRRSSQRYPLAQVQAIDVVQTGLARVLGLAELRLRMAGGAARGGGRLQSVKQSEAEPLRARLLALAHGLSPDAAAAGPARSAEAADMRPLLVIPTGRLVSSIALSGLGIVVAVLVVGLVALASVDGAAVVAALSTSAALVVGIATGVYRRFNGAYRLAVAVGSDGFHLRSGLVETTMETIPVRRVQAVRIVEPLLWRPMGWCRLEVEVAGRRVREENAAQGRQRRALLPVGPKALAGQLLELLVPGAPPADRKAPRRAAWKAPLSYHWLAYGRNGHAAVTQGGRLRLVHHWVPLGKVQSIRRVQGPLQRRLGLASLHLDTAGRSLHAVFRDRSVAEVDAELAVLPDLCRAARRGSAGPPAHTP